MSFLEEVAQDLSLAKGRGLSRRNGNLETAETAGGPTVYKENGEQSFSWLSVG